MLKKLIKNCLSTLIICGVSIPCLCLWLGGGSSTYFPYSGEWVDKIECAGYTALWDCVYIKQDEKYDEWSETIIRRLLWVFGLKKDKNNDLKFLDYARAIINMALWLISFIALIMTIYTFYMVIFSENDAGIKKAKWNLVGIFIALAIIGLAWIIVSFIFRWYQKNWEERADDIKEGNITFMNRDVPSYQIYLTI